MGGGEWGVGGRGPGRWVQSYVCVCMPVEPEVDAGWDRP